MRAQVVPKDNKTTDALKKLLRRFGGQDRKLVMHLSTLQNFTGVGMTL